jgi:hypothetical protein
MSPTDEPNQPARLVVIDANGTVLTAEAAGALVLAIFENGADHEGFSARIIQNKPHDI